MAVCTWVQWCHSAMFETNLHGELTKSSPLKGGLESVLQTNGMPNIENMRSRRGMTHLAETEAKASSKQFRE